MKNPLLLVDIIAWIVFLFQALVIWAGMYEVHTKGKTDIYASPFLVLISLAWIIYRFLS